MNDSGHIFFVSFDLINSTKIKNLYPKKWFVWISYFFEFIRHVVLSSNNKDKEVSIWKLLGDEIIFQYRIKSKAGLYYLPQFIFEAQVLVEDYINKELNIDLDLFRIKSAVWVSSYRYLQNESIDENTNNSDHNYDPVHPDMMFEIITSNLGKPVESTVDIIGPEMDIGFRISKNANKAFTVYSLRAFYILLNLAESEEENIVLNKFRIIGFDLLKGVWDGKPYPIIWYSNNWEQSLSRMKYFDRLKLPSTVEKNKIDFSSIENILKDLGKEQEYTMLVNSFFETIKEDKVSSESELSINPDFLIQGESLQGQSGSVNFTFEDNS